MSLSIGDISSHASKLLDAPFVCSMLNGDSQRVPDGAFIEVRICPPRSGQVAYRASPKTGD